MRERLNRRSVDMSVKQQLVTAEELWHMPKVPGMRFELIDGEVVKVSPASIRHGVIASAVHDAIKLHVRQQDLGLVMGDNVGYVLRHDPDHMRAPDVSFLAWDSVPEGDDLERFGQGPPTLAVEVVSPNDRANDIRCGFFGLGGIPSPFTVQAPTHVNSAPTLCSTAATC
jgi:Uma2 family endonuclease